MTCRILSNDSLCIGCYACVVACMQANELPAGCSLIDIEVKESTDLPYDLECSISYCLHCQEPFCIDACPSQAIKKMDDGTVIILQELCEICGCCLEACPYSAIKINHFRGVASKCDLCQKGDSEKHVPACVRHCPSGALRFENVAITARKY